MFHNQILLVIYILSSEKASINIVNKKIQFKGF